MNRRNFLAAAIAAPFVVRSGVLMPVRQIVAPPLAIMAGNAAAIALWSGALFREVEKLSLFHQWLRDGVPIAGATDRIYVLTADDIGRTHSIVVPVKVA